MTKQDFEFRYKLLCFASVSNPNRTLYDVILLFCFMLYHARIISVIEDRKALPSKKETREQSTQFLKELKHVWRKAGVKLAPA